MNNICLWCASRDGGVDLHTTEALDEYFEGRHFEQLFTWPEQGLVIYMVGRR